MSEATTQGVRVSVKSAFIKEQSTPTLGRYAFAYTVRIENRGERTAQLRSRHWIIIDGNGERQEVRGDGVVGEQPTIPPGKAFEYTSGCILKTPHGVMQGSYLMYGENGVAFEAVIAPFSLTQPHALN